MTSLENKKRELEEAVKGAKKKFRAEDDKAQLAIGELKGKQKQVSSYFARATRARPT